MLQQQFWLHRVCCSNSCFVWTGLQMGHTKSKNQSFMFKKINFACFVNKIVYQSTIMMHRKKYTSVSYWLKHNLAVLTIFRLIWTYPEFRLIHYQWKNLNNVNNTHCKIMTNFFSYWIICRNFFLQIMTGKEILKLMRWLIWRWSVDSLSVKSN